MRKYALETAFTSNLTAWTRLSELHLWQVALSVPEGLPAAVSYRLRVLSLRDVDASPAALDLFFPNESVQSLDRLTLDYTCSSDRADEGRTAFGTSLARIVSVAAPQLSYLSLMAPKDTFGAEDDQMVAALRRLGPRLRYLCVGGAAIQHAHFTAVTQLAPLSQVRQVELCFLIEVAPIAIVAALEDDSRWPMLHKLRIRRYEVRHASSWPADLTVLRAHGLAWHRPDAQLGVAKGADATASAHRRGSWLRRAALRRAREPAGRASRRRSSELIAQEAYTTDEAEATEDDEVERADDNGAWARLYSRHCATSACLVALWRPPGAELTPPSSVPARRIRP